MRMLSKRFTEELKVSQVPLKCSASHKPFWKSQVLLHLPVKDILLQTRLNFLWQLLLFHTRLWDRVCPQVTAHHVGAGAESLPPLSPPLPFLQSCSRAHGGRYHMCCSTCAHEAGLRTECQPNWGELSDQSWVACLKVCHLDTETVACQSSFSPKG